MDQNISVTFNYPVIVYDAALLCLPTVCDTPGTASPAPLSTGKSAAHILQSTVTDRLQKNCEDVMTQHKCQISISSPSQTKVVFFANNTVTKGVSTASPLPPSFPESNPGSTTANQSGFYELNFSITLHGGVNQVMTARGALLRQNLSQVTEIVKANRRIILNANEETKLSVRARLNMIMEMTNSQITILGQNFYNDPAKPRPPPGLHGAAENSIDIEIIGTWDVVEKARVLTLVHLDEISGLRTLAVEVDPKLHALIVGRRREILNTIMNDTVTNIYFPSPLLVQNWKPKEDSGAPTLPFYMKIYITGEPADTIKARDLLLALAAEKKANLKIRSVTCLPRKIDWMLINRKDELKKIMYDNAVFISLPPLGNQSNFVSVYGDDPVYVERAVRAFMLLAAEFYIAYLQLATNVFALNGPSSGTNLINQIVPALCDIIQSSRAEVVFKASYVEIYGLEAATKMAFKQLTAVHSIEGYIRDTKFQLELAFEHQDFIQGKKNGKINKIIKASGCKITFHERYNEYNMLIDVVTPYPTRALEGLVLLEEELPAELSMKIPDLYHKRIIGVGGKNIQRIMKTYGVFVKFSGADEHATFGGYYENEDNVIVRTPAKNRAQLQPFKNEVMELVDNLPQKETSMNLTIPREYHRLVLGPKGKNIYEVKNATKVEIVFPQKESGSEEVILRGTDVSIQKARNLILELVPEVFEFQIPASPGVDSALSNEDWVGLISHLSDTNTSVLVFKPRMNKNGNYEGDYSILIYHWRGNSKLDKVRNLLGNYLQSKQITTQTSQLPRSGSSHVLPGSKSYNSFQVFSSKLFAPVTEANPIFNKAQPNGAEGAFEGLGKTRNMGNASSLRQAFEEGSNPPSASGTSRYSDFESRGRTSGQEQHKPYITRSQCEISPDRQSHASAGRQSQHSGSFAHTHHMGTSVPSTPYEEYQKAQQGQILDHVRQPDPQFVGMLLSKSLPSTQLQEMMRQQQREASGLGSGVKLEDTLSAKPSMADENNVPGLLTLEEMEYIVGSNDEIDCLLTTISLTKYGKILEEEEVDFATLLTLTEGDLKEIGITALGARKKIMGAISDLKRFKARGLNSSAGNLEGALANKNKAGVDERKEPVLLAK